LWFRVLRAIPAIGNRHHKILLCSWDTITITMDTPTKTSQPSAEVQEICDRLKKIGYAISARIRMYGEEFEVTSNPYPDGKGISVEAVSKRENRARVLRIPLPILQTVARVKAAA
jgi:hypothetical protein